MIDALGIPRPLVDGRFTVSVLTTEGEKLPWSGYLTNQIISIGAITLSTNSSEWYELELLIQDTEDDGVRQALSVLLGWSKVVVFRINLLDSAANTVGVIELGKTIVRRVVQPPLSYYDVNKSIDLRLQVQYSGAKYAVND